jgi:succinyl-CoA synthetase beta subunit
MKLHEYQARELLARYGVPVPGGDVAETSHDAERIATLYNGSVVVKAQVLMGGRGKAGGIRLCETPEEAGKAARDILGKRLVSPQNPQGMVVEKVLVVERLDIEREYYLAVLIDRSRQADVVMLSAEGGMDIEEIAREKPEAIARVYVKPRWGIWDYEVRAVLRQLGVERELWREFAEMVRKVYRAFVESDATLVEINPCVKTSEGKLVAADAKVILDDNALYRHPEFQNLSEETAEDPLEMLAARKGIAYVRLDGEVGVMGNGAGLVMLTLDEIARAGKRAANFLDVGGGAQASRVKECVELVLRDERVKALLINIFGGITRGDEVARGIVDALSDMEVKVPIVVRIEGTNAEEAKEILSQAKLIPAETIAEAAQKVAQLV